MTDIHPDALKKRYRLVLKLGKFVVLERHETTLKIGLGGSTTMTVTAPVLVRSDVQPGDVLTFYTEVPYANPKGFTMSGTD